MKLLSPVLILLLICLFQTEAQYKKADNVVLIKRGGEQKKVDCGRSGTIGEKCRNGLICRTLNGESECSGKKSLQIKKNMFCGQKDTLQRRCQSGGICIRTAKKSFKCKKGGPGRGGKRGSGGKRGKGPAKPEAPKEVHVPNQIDCDAMGVPPTCRAPTMLYFGGQGGGLFGLGGIGATSYPRCNSDFWKQLPDSAGDVGLAIMKGEMYACGGALDNGEQYLTDCYKNVGGNWVKNANLNTPRSKHTMTTMGNSMIVAGGRNNEGFRLLSSMEIFKGEKWETLEHKLPIPVKAHCAVAISDKEILFIAGDNTNGQHGGQTVGNQVQTYHLEKGFTGDQIPNLKRGRYNHGCALYKNEVYVFGGDDHDHRGGSGDYQWTGGPRAKVAPQAAAAPGSNGSVPVLDTSHEAICRHMEILNLETRTWRDGLAPGIPDKPAGQEDYFYHPNLVVLGNELIMEDEDNGEVWHFDGTSWRQGPTLDTAQRHRVIAYNCK